MLLASQCRRRVESVRQMLVVVFPGAPSLVPNIKESVIPTQKIYERAVCADLLASAGCQCVAAKVNSNCHLQALLVPLRRLESV